MEEGIRRVNRILDDLELEQQEAIKLGLEPEPLPDIRATLIFDMQGFLMANMDFPLVKFLAETLQNHYPEVLHNVCVIDAPWIFQTCWSIIKGWLDPVVASKIQFMNRDQLITLLDAELIPIMNGGSCQHKKMWDPSMITTTQTTETTETTETEETTDLTAMITTETTTETTTEITATADLTAMITTTETTTTTEITEITISQQDNNEKNDNNATTTTNNEF